MMSRYRRWSAGLHPLERVAVCLWAALLLGVLGRVAVAPVGSGTVLPIYLTAGARWAAGEDVYFSPLVLDYYRNPPGVTPLLVPFTWVPPRAAGLLWRALSATVFLLGLRAWPRHGFPRPWSGAQWGAVFALVVPLAQASLNNGQTNLFLAGFLLLGTAAAARGGMGRGGLWLAAGAGVKIYPAAVGLLLSAAYPRRLLPWFAAGLAAAAGLPYLTQDAEYVTRMYRSFATLVGFDDRSLADFNRAPQDLFLLLRVWVAPPPPEAYRAVQLGVAAAMAGLVLLARRRGRTDADVATLALNLGCVWMTLLGPATEASTYTVLAPTAAVVLVTAHADRRSAGGRTRLLLALAAWGLLNASIFRDMFPNGVAFRRLGPMPAGALVLLAVLAWQALRRADGGRRGVSPPCDGRTRTAA